MDHHESKDHAKEPLLHAKNTHHGESHSDNESDNHHHHQPRHSAHQIGHHEHGGQEYDADELLEQKGLRLIPVFGDHRFSMFSMNYGLYLEFFHIIARMLGRLFLLVIFFNLIDMATKQYIFDRVSYQSDEVMAVCGKYGEKADICAKELYILSKCYRHSVRVAYAIVTSFCAAIFMAVIRSRDEERVINNRMLYEFNWTQDLFSVLVDKIPKKTVPDELRAYFNNLPAIKKVGGHVKDIVMVQDFGKCYLISKQIQKLTDQIEELHEQGKDAHELEGKIQFLKEELVREEARMPPHSGRAIVVFDSLKTKALVMKLYRPAFGAFIEKKFRKKKKNGAELEEASLTVKDLPEPQDLKFENMCYPRSQKLRRLMFVYAIGLLIVVVGAAAGFWFEVLPEAEELSDHAKHEVHNLFESPVVNGVIKVKPMHEEEHHHSIFRRILSAIGIPVMLLVLEGVSESLFKRLNKFTRHKSHSEIEIACLDYSIFSSFFLYLFIQGAIMAFAWEEGGAVVQTTIKIFCVKYVGKKLASAYFAYRNKHAGEHSHSNSHSPSHSPSRSHSMAADSHVEELDRRLSRSTSIIHSPHGHGHGHGHKKKELHLSLLAKAVKILFHVDIENEEFDFFEEASRAFPLIAMNFAFMANGKTSISLTNLFPPGIPITILAIYIGAFCDKYRLINAHEHCHLNSARFMLKMFRFLRGDHFAAIFGAGVWTLSFYMYVSGYQNQVLQMEFAENNKTKFETIFSNLNTSIITAVVTIISFYIFYLIAWPKNESLETQFGKKFLDNKSGVSYDTVSSGFTAVYQKPVLYHAEEHKLKQSLIL